MTPSPAPSTNTGGIGDPYSSFSATTYTGSAGNPVLQGQYQSPYGFSGQQIAPVASPSLMLAPVAVAAYIPPVPQFTAQQITMTALPGSIPNAPGQMNLYAQQALAADIAALPQYVSNPVQTASINADILNLSKILGQP